MVDDDYLGTLLDMFEITEPKTSRSPLESALKISPLPSDNPGQAFLNWVKKGIQSHKLIINDSKAKVHTVSGRVFLVTPGIFQRYAQEFPGISMGADHEGEEWRWVQKQFERLKTHKKRDDGLNIWLCQVEGPRKKAKLKGYILENSALFFEAGSMPSDNPFLKLEK
jgi:hypothetical protein